ncbi:MAG: cell division protein FtsL [Candidatus Marinimicrobia bacterium]|nr:cell division protein FtsL [Candidatus Neomarinimicrobiota bacterium]
MKKRRKSSINFLNKIPPSLFAFIVIMFLLFQYIYVGNTIRILNAEITRLQEIRAKLITQNNIISAEIERLSGPDRIKEIAQDKLGMVIPKPETLLVVINQQEE